MGRDANVWKRNLLVLPGGLLASYAAAALAYIYLYRAHYYPTGGPCGYPQKFQIGGVCYNAVPGLVAALLLGAVLIAVGLAVFRGRPAALQGYLYHGTPMHFVLTLLASLAAMLALVAAVLSYLEATQRTQFGTTLLGVAYRTTFLFNIAALVAFLIFLPFLVLYLAQVRVRDRFLHEVRASSQGNGEQDARRYPGEAGEPMQASSAGAARSRGPAVTNPAVEDFGDETAWPESRASEWSAGAAATTMAVPARVPPAPAKSAAKAPVVRQGPGCRAMVGNGAECGRPVGPGGRYCLRHACQAMTTAGTPCRNPAMEGTTRCAAHQESA
jgi:hypothetical protein